MRTASAKQYADAVADYVERMEATTPSWVPICRDDE